MRPLFETRDLSKHFPVRGGWLKRTRSQVRAVDGIDLSLRKGESFALVGESGCGKTTLGRCMTRLIEPTSGGVWFKGEDLLALSGKGLRQRRRHFQMIFQDPYGSLNPRMRVEQTLSEPLAVHRLVERSRRRDRVLELLATVGLPASAARRYPHEFSGGQRQRIGIARAIATEPELLVADEPVSALDVSVQAQIVNLLAELQSRLDLTLVFIAHDLAVVEQIADRVGVLYLGQIVERAPCREVFARPQHPYTASLLSAVPVPDPQGRRRRIVLPGDPPSAIDPPAGCRFHTRCPIARRHCAHDEPPLHEVAAGHWASCHYPGELTPEAASKSATQPGTF